MVELILSSVSVRIQAHVSQLKYRFDCSVRHSNILAHVGD